VNSVFSVAKIKTVSQSALERGTRFFSLNGSDGVPSVTCSPFVWDISKLLQAF
jgi:hypothetical protein